MPKRSASFVTLWLLGAATCQTEVDIADLVINGRFATNLANWSAAAHARALLPWRKAAGTSVGLRPPGRTRVAPHPPWLSGASENSTTFPTSGLLAAIGSSRFPDR